MQHAIARFILALLALVVTNTGAADKKYDPGVTDTEIKIGQTMPYSGPVSAYGTIGRTQLAYFKMVNEKGGINGRKINLISLDDSYSPPKTVEQVRKLVEQEEVFALFQTLGSGPNTAIIQYTNARKIPNLFIASVFDKHADHQAYPWTIPWNPSGLFEGTVEGQWLFKQRPNARIALLYQNDDLGKDLIRGFKSGLGEAAARMVIAESSYELSDPTVDSQVVTLKASGADVLYVAGTPKFGAQAIRKVYDLGWRPLFMISNTLSASESTLKPAGLDKAVGLITAGYFKYDPDQYPDDPAMQEYLAFMRKYYPEANANDSTNIYGYIAAKAFEEVLKRCGDNLTRENLMRQATSLTNLLLPLLHEGVTVTTSPTNHRPLTRLRMARFDGKHWVLFDSPMAK